MRGSHRIYAAEYPTYLSDLGAEYVRQRNGKLLFYVPSDDMWVVAQRGSDPQIVTLDFFDNEADCGC